jgi:CheY-like chemotaxis protein
MDRRRARNPPSRPLVLIIDGHDDTRDLYVEALSGLGFEVIAVDDDAHAYERAWESRPDIIVTELTLPHSDGWHLLQRLKSDPRTRSIPVVVVTGQAAPGVRERAEREACAAFFVKPCLPDKLAIQLRQLIERTAHATASY